MATANTKRNEDAREDDLYTTPDWAIRSILKRELMGGSICDAGYGTGNITRALVANGMDRKQITGIDKYLHALDLDILCDFTVYNDKQFNNVITNPPYKLFIDFVRQAIKISNAKTLVFARINALETVNRFNAIYKDNPPQRIYGFVNRVACPKGYDSEGVGAVMYCWIVWDKKSNPNKTTEFHWINDHPKDLD